MYSTSVERSNIWLIVTQTCREYQYIWLLSGLFDKYQFTTQLGACCNRGCHYCNSCHIMNNIHDTSRMTMSAAERYIDSVFVRFNRGLLLEQITILSLNDDAHLESKESSFVALKAHISTRYVFIIKYMQNRMNHIHTNRILLISQSFTSACSLQSFLAKNLNKIKGTLVHERR